MTAISVGLRNDGTLDVDMAPKPTADADEDWTFHNIDLEEAAFLRDELDDAIKRAKAKGLPKPPELPAKTEDDMDLLKP